VKESGHGLVEVITRRLPGEAEENHGKSQNSFSPRRDLKEGHCEYEAGILPTLTRLFMLRHVKKK
jgi:hypothetical protein